MPETTPRSLDRNQPRVIYIKSEVFSEVESGRKTLELRIAFSSFSNIKTGDTIEFRKGDNRGIKVKVKDVRNYSNLESVLDKEEVNKIAPGFSKEQALSQSEKLLKQSDIENHGLIVIDFERI